MAMKYMLLAALMLVAYANCQTTPVPILKQINRVNDDGSYTYGFEAADGTFKVETRDNLGNVMGKYGYIDETGQMKTIEYQAGAGFQATGDHIPAPTGPAARPVVKPVPARTTSRPRPPPPTTAARVHVPVPAPVHVKNPATTTNFLPTPVVSTPDINQFQTQRFQTKPRVTPQQFNDVDNSGVNNIRRGFSFAFEAPVFHPPPKPLESQPKFNQQFRF